MSNLLQTKQYSWLSMLLQAAQEISLTPSQYEKIDSRYQTLKDILDGASSPILSNAHIFVQGSIGLRTTIKPATNARSAEMMTVDADAIILLPNAVHVSAIDVLNVIQCRFQEASRTKSPVKPLRRGIRIVYADENPGFHIDITPAISAPGNNFEDGYGELLVPDRDIKDWKYSAPRDYSKWLETAAQKAIQFIPGCESFAKEIRGAIYETTQDPIPEYGDYLSGSVLQAVIKLLKRHRDEWASQNEEFAPYRPISAILTTLATHAYSQIASNSIATPFEPLNMILSIIDKMPEFIHQNIRTQECFVNNPCASMENFAEKWNRPGSAGKKYFEAFNAWHDTVRQDFRLGLGEYEESIYKSKFTKSWGLREEFISSAESSLPGTWALPGRTRYETLNERHLAIATGFVNTGTADQNITPPGRLG